MLRLLLKVFAGLVALVLLAVGVIAVALPRVVETEEFQAALRGNVARAVGTPVEWSALEVGLFPLRLVVKDPSLGETAVDQEAARFSADSLDLRLSAWALLARQVEVDSLVLRGVDLVVTRTVEGLILPIRSQGTPLADPVGEESPPERQPEESAAVGLAIRRIVLADSRILLRDRSLELPVDLQFESVEFTAEGDSLDEAFEVDFAAELATGGTPRGAVQTSGTASLGGLYALDVQLDQVVLSEFQAYLPGAGIEGEASGGIRLEGTPDVVSRLDTDLQVEKMKISTSGLDLAGRLELDSERAGTGPTAFDLELDLGDGGTANAKGTRTEEGAIDARVDLQALEVASFGSFIGSGVEVAGRASGQMDVGVSSEGEVTHLSTDLIVADARYATALQKIAGDLNLTLMAKRLGESDPVQFETKIALQGGGQVGATGVATLAGALDAKIDLASVALEQVAAWVPDGTTLSGALTGQADLRLTSDRTFERLETQFRVAEARLVSESVDVSGVFDLDAKLTEAGPIDLAGTLKLADQSQLSATGTSTVDGVFDLALKLEAFDLAVAKPFLPNAEMQIGGRATGAGRFEGQATAPNFVSFDGGIEAGVIKTTEYAIEGPFQATLKVKEPLSQPRGEIALDLTTASLRYLDQFTKAAGTRAEMTTTFAPDDSGATVFESQLKLREIDEILLQGSIGETTSVAVSTTSFNLQNWSEIFPALSTYQAEGVVEFNGLAIETFRNAPSQFGGSIVLQGVDVAVPDAGRFRLTGSFLGEKTKIRTDDLQALVGGVPFGLKGVIDDPLGQKNFDFQIETREEAEVNGLLSEWTTKKDVVFGLLSLAGELQGSFGGSGDLMQTLTGDLRFLVGEKEGGRIRGGSILRSILDQIPLLGGAARLSAPFRGGKSVDDYYTENFEVIEGEFVVAGGEVDARTLRLVYPGYEARLAGPMRLRDFGIDLKGEVILNGDLVSAIGGLAGATIDREPIQIQLAKVGNTLNDPKVSMTRETLAAVPKLLLQATGFDRLTLGIGKGISDALGRVLGGGEQ